MKINVEINSLVKAAADGKLIKKEAVAVIEGEATCLPDGREVEVSIAIVGPERIREINKKYRKKDQVTDVLSFSEDSPAEGDSDYPKVLGELVICLERVNDDAKEAGISIKDELAWVVVHGMLHLFGYDHETDPAGALKMRQKEEFYLSKIRSVKLKAQSAK